MSKTSLIRWSNDQLPEEVKAAAALEGRSMNALLEDAAAEYVARRAHGQTPTSVRNVFVQNSSYQLTAPTYRSLSDQGLGHEDIINQLGSGPAPTEGEQQ